MSVHKKFQLDRSSRSAAIDNIYIYECLVLLLRISAIELILKQMNQKSSIKLKSKI